MVSDKNGGDIPRYIYKKIEVCSIKDHTISKTELTVQGYNLDKVKKIFDEEWQMEMKR